MKSMLQNGFAVLVGVTLLAPPLSAKVAAPNPVPQRAAVVDGIVTGKVTSIENKTLTIDKMDYQVAVVQIVDGIVGTKNLTHVRIAFLPQTPGGFNRFPHLNLQVGQEACFFLTKAKNENAYTFKHYFDVVNRDNPSFKSDVEIAKKCGKVLKDVDAALKSKTAEDRVLAAIMLVYRYRAPNNTDGKQEPIDAAQSKLILEALAGADWDMKDWQAPLNPTRVFSLLPDKEKFGWGAPGGTPGKWLKDNADKYRIQRFVTN